MFVVLKNGYLMKKFTIILEMMPLLIGVCLLKITFVGCRVVFFDVFTYFCLIFDVVVGYKNKKAQNFHSTLFFMCKKITLRSQYLLFYSEPL